MDVDEVVKHLYFEKGNGPTFKRRGSLLYMRFIHQ